MVVFFFASSLLSMYLLSSSPPFGLGENITDSRYQGGKKEQENNAGAKRERKMKVRYRVERKVEWSHGCPGSRRRTRMPRCDLPTNIQQIKRDGKGLRVSCTYTRTSCTVTNTKVGSSHRRDGRVSKPTTRKQPKSQGYLFGSPFFTPRRLHRSSPFPPQQLLL